MSADTIFTALYTVAIPIVTGLIVWVYILLKKNKSLRSAASKEKEERIKELHTEVQEKIESFDTVKADLFEKLENFTKEFNHKLYSKLDIISNEIQKISVFIAVQNVTNEGIQTQLKALRNELNVIGEKVAEFEKRVNEEISSLQIAFNHIQNQHENNHNVKVPKGLGTQKNARLSHS